jgi:hypothetical protein
LCAGIQDTIIERLKPDTNVLALHCLMPLCSA